MRSMVGLNIFGALRILLGNHLSNYVVYDV